MNKEILIRNFSRCVYTYDRYADIHRRIASELLELIKEDGVAKILEIGCGTGNYTLLLRDKFSNARLKAIDISKEMVEIAKEKLKDKDVEFIVADAEDTDLYEDFDLITSNACFQWFEDLERALIKYKNLLKRDGLILFSIFGPFTFWELNTALNFILKDVSIEAANFKTFDRIKDILNKNFREVKMSEVRYKESFPRLRDLLNKIKYTGIKGDGLCCAKVSFGPQFLKKLEEIYLDKFKKIKVTYQIFFCEGLKK